MVTKEYFIQKRKFTTSYIITRRKNVYLELSLCNHVWGVVIQMKALLMHRLILHSFSFKISNQCSVSQF